MPTTLSLRYIVFFIDSKYKNHDGKIVNSLSEARILIKDAFSDKYCDKALIGMFLLEPNASEMMITMVETFGFKNDKKQLNQLDLFKPFNS